MTAPLLLALLLAAGARAQTSDGTPIPRIAVKDAVFVGEDHPPFDLADFPVTAEGAEAHWVPGSVKWFRGADGLALPSARLRVSVSVPPERALLRWHGLAVELQEADGGSAAEVFVPLLDGGEIGVEVDGKTAGKVRASAGVPAATPPGRRHAIDHSCSPWGVSVTGLDDAFVTMNCRMVPVGKIGHQEPYLDVRWTAAPATLPDGGPVKMVAALRDARLTRVTVTGADGKPRVVEIAAAVPPRMHLLRLAWGAGPYGLNSSARVGNGAAGALMLYGNLRLRNEGGLSVRAFEAAVGQSPSQSVFFNNLGLYFAYDLANVWDSRMRLTALLGMQGVSYAPNGLAHGTYNEAVFPQGFEISYFDAFGQRNKTLSGGMFLQPVTNKPYQNFWVRYGGRVFGELNYISWRSYDRRAKTWGVSVGAPFAQLF